MSIRLIPVSYSSAFLVLIVSLLALKLVPDAAAQECTTKSCINCFGPQCEKGPSAWTTVEECPHVCFTVFDQDNRTHVFARNCFHFVDEPFETSFVSIKHPVPANSTSQLAKFIKKLDFGPHDLIVYVCHTQDCNSKDYDATRESLVAVATPDVDRSGSSGAGADGGGPSSGVVIGLGVVVALLVVVVIALGVLLWKKSEESSLYNPTSTGGS